MLMYKTDLLPNAGYWRYFEIFMCDCQQKKIYYILNDKKLEIILLLKWKADMTSDLWIYA